MFSPVFPVKKLSAFSQRSTNAPTPDAAQPSSSCKVTEMTGTQANRILAAQGEYTKLFYITYCEKAFTQSIRVASNATVDQVKDIAVAEFNKDGRFTKLSVEDATIYPTPRSTSTTLGQLEKLNSNTPPVVVCGEPQASSPLVTELHEHRAKACDIKGKMANLKKQLATAEEKAARGWAQIADDGARREHLAKMVNEQEAKYKEPAAIHEDMRTRIAEESLTLQPVVYRLRRRILLDCERQRILCEMDR
ncbi:hypothetical protein HK102_013257 [Quaeritorhiza haematococci]|nr:hypothetical protein HK102_013257 [Quaeritorhiza haematococci]